MALCDFSEEYQLHKKTLYVVIGIFHKPGYGTKSPINYMLKRIEESLKKEINDYGEIQVAYVYENENLMNVKPFMKFSKDTPIFYKNPCRDISNHKFHHIYFMGMSLLKEEKNRSRNADYRFYMVTDEKIERVNHVVYNSDNGVQVHSGFDDSEIKLVLCRTEYVNDILEDYIHTTMNSSIWMMGDE